MSQYEQHLAVLLLMLPLYTHLAVARVTTVTMQDNSIVSARPSFEKYTKLRQEYVSQHLSRALGADIELSEEEQHLNAVLMELKADELARGFDNPFNFTPARHFFSALKSIETSPLFKLIQKMPKGAYMFDFKLQLPNNFLLLQAAFCTRTMTQSVS
jgi:hypothetical protein